MEKGLVEEAGRLDVPGKPIVYRTTSVFLRSFGLSSTADLPPLPGQEVALDILAGESKDSLVKADSTDGKADRIRIVNRDMKKEAVFKYTITAAK